MDDGDLRPQLDALVRAEAARELLATYAAACDARDVGAVGRLFVPGAVLESRERHEGLDAILTFYESSFRSDPTPTRHFVTNVAVRPERSADAGDEVAVTSYFLFVRQDDPSRIAGCGTYEDLVRFEPDRPPRFSTKRIVMQRDEREQGAGAADRSPSATTDDPTEGGPRR